VFIVVKRITCNFESSHGYSFGDEHKCSTWSFETKGVLFARSEFMQKVFEQIKK